MDGDLDLVLGVIDLDFGLDGGAVLLRERGHEAVLQQPVQLRPVEVQLGRSIVSVDAAHARLDDGTVIPTRTIVWAAGVKANPLADWSDDDCWAYIRERGLPYNALHDRGYPSIGCDPCTRAIRPGEDIRAGRWWWESADRKECGLHRRPQHRERVHDGVRMMVDLLALAHQPSPAVRRAEVVLQRAVRALAEQLREHPRFRDSLDDDVIIDTLHDARDNVQLLAALEQTAWNRSDAARRLRRVA